MRGLKDVDFEVKFSFQNVQFDKVANLAEGSFASEAGRLVYSQFVTQNINNLAISVPISVVLRLDVILNITQVCQMQDKTTYSVQTAGVC